HGLRRERHDPARWRLLVLEDCDEIVSVTAKAASGQALSRVLNLTDGLPGQGLHLLLAITTNEKLSALHPAVTRPGRCLAEIEIGCLPPSEAREWLGRSASMPAAGLTLAELYEQRGDLEVVTLERDEPPSGLYL